MAWDDLQNTKRNVGGYYLYDCQSDWEEPKRVDVGLQTTYTLRDLEVGRFYTFAVMHGDGKGSGESAFSHVVYHRMLAPNMRDIPK